MPDVSATPPLPASPSSPLPPPPGGYGPAPYGPPRRRGSKLGWIVAAVLAVLLLLSVVVILGLGAAVAPLLQPGETVVRPGGGMGAPRVAVLPVEGGIDDPMAGYVREALRKLGDNPPAALILRVESGGGGVTASDQIWHAVSEFRAAHPEVPVLGSFGGVAASGGYYIAAGCDTLTAEPTTITGSIGVIAQVPTVAELADKVGVDVVTVTATGSPDKDVANNLFREWGDADRQKLKVITDSAYARFTEVVASGRGDRLPAERMPEVADGDVYTAEQAVANGLVDGIGYLDDVIDAAAAAAKLGDDPRVVRVTRPVPGLLQALVGTPGARGGGLEAFGSPDQLRALLDELGTVRLLYRLNW